MSNKLRNKNIRLTHDAWNQLRILKFEQDMATYSDVFEMLFDFFSNDHAEIKETVKAKVPKDTGQVPNTHKDKTIVVNEDIHRTLAFHKIELLKSTGSTSRGPGAVSISDVVLALIGEYKEKSESQ